MEQFYVLCVLYSVILTPAFTQETFNTMPPPVVTNFTCHGRPMGFYADLEMNCRVYHNCDDHGNKFTYYCPIDTAFRQEAMVCDHAHLVKCQSVEENPPNKSGQSTPHQSTIPSFKGTQNIARKSSGFSRSFRIGEDNVPSNSVQNKNPTFIFSSSVFLRNHSDALKKPTTFQSKNFNFPVTKSPLEFSRSTINEATNFPTKRIPLSTAQPFSGKAFTVRDSPNRFSNPDLNSNFQQPLVRNDNFFKHSNFAKTTSKPENVFSKLENEGNKDKSSFFVNQDDMQIFPKSKSRPLMFLEPPLFESGKTIGSGEFNIKSPFNFGNSNYPYMETLRSIQREARTEHSLISTTRKPATTRPTAKRFTEFPLYALTASLKSLASNEEEYDPYYPKFSTSTEIYYTPRDLGKNNKSSKVTTRKPSTDLHLKIPSMLPDLNSLEDLVDRRKIFYIPKLKST